MQKNNRQKERQLQETHKYQAEWLREKRKEEQKTRSNGQTGTNGQTDHRLTHKKERKGKQSVG